MGKGMAAAIMCLLLGGTPTLKIIVGDDVLGHAMRRAWHDREMAWCELDPLYPTYQDIVDRFHVEFIDLEQTDLHAVDHRPFVVIGRRVIGQVDVCEWACGCCVANLHSLLECWELEQLEIRFRSKYEYVQEICKRIRQGRCPDGFNGIWLKDHPIAPFYDGSEDWIP